MKDTYKNCFANKKPADDTHCAVLTEKLCVTKGKCPFYKTQKQFDKDEKKYGGIHK